METVPAMSYANIFITKKINPKILETRIIIHCPHCIVVLIMMSRRENIHTSPCVVKLPPLSCPTHHMALYCQPRR